ncbi:hypothetical protein RvY_04701 [Ramazzottius varieornatus]|uniref:Uncharacterized protein n=1 Tax=Ramazzottius varieornatus TaxID=947166 RepID=A0A1D1UVU7_RAMVA|nr:hypothetical protein RvY_04701 [Ramazzottius varieornatus]
MAPQPYGRIGSQQGRLPLPPRNFGPPDRERSRSWEPSFRHRPLLSRFTHANIQRHILRADPPERQPSDRQRFPSGCPDSFGQGNQSVPSSPLNQTTPPSEKMAVATKHPEERLAEERRRFKSNGIWKETLRLLSEVEKKNPEVTNEVDTLRILNGSSKSENALQANVDDLQNACEELSAEADRLAVEEQELIKKLNELKKLEQHDDGHTVECP